MSIGTPSAARAGPSSTLATSKKSKAKKAKGKVPPVKPSLTALQTPPPTPTHHDDHKSSKQSARKGADNDRLTEQEEPVADGPVKYYETFLANLYAFGMAAEAGTWVEECWDLIVKMDPIKISVSLREAKVEQTKKKKQSCGPGCKGKHTPLEAEGTSLERASDDLRDSLGMLLDHEPTMPDPMKAMMLDILGPDWTDQMKSFTEKLRALRYQIDSKYGDSGVPAASCGDPNCDCSIPYVSTFEIDAAVYEAGRETKLDLHSDSAIKSAATKTSSTGLAPHTPTTTSRPISPMPSASRRDQPLSAPMTPVTGTPSAITTTPADTAAPASPLDAALSELRGKTISTPRLRDLWLLAVRNMPRKSETYTFRPAPIYEATIARYMPRLPSKINHGKARANEMMRIFTSEHGKHILHLVGGSEDDAKRHLSKDVARGPTVYEVAHIANFGQMAMLSLDSEIDPASGRRRVEFTPIPLYFVSEELKAPQRKRKSFEAFKEKMSKQKPLCHKLYMHVGVVQLDEDVPMAWSVHFVTRKAIVYPAVPGKADSALECIRRLVALIECCEDCEKRPWKVEVGKMWMTDHRDAYALTTHILQELIINQSACIEGLDPRKYTQGEPPQLPSKALLSEAQMWWLMWHQTQLRIDNFYALKKLSDELGIVSA